ncbi:MAG TPA: CpaD family pilus assembly lipoprotein [Stellaceae bacterium]|nr:CpaD family pilus assembly lipoprotein [Stellaceae bacterium]
MATRTLAPLFAALTLAACASQGNADLDGALGNQVQPLHVDHVRVQYSAAFAPGASELPVSEAMRLQTFLDQAGLRPNDRVYVATPSGDPLAASRIGKIADLLARRAVGVATVATPPQGVPPNHILVLVDRYVVMQPACPNWSASPETGHDNVPTGNFGCATMSNLSLMIANPRDLMAGREMGPADGDPSLNAIARYRADQVKPFSTGSGSGAAAAPGGGSSSSSSSTMSGSSASTTSGGGGATTGGAPTQ